MPATGSQTFATVGHLFLPAAIVVVLAGCRALDRPELLGAPRTAESRPASSTTLASYTSAGPTRVVFASQQDRDRALTQDSAILDIETHDLQPQAHLPISYADRSGSVALLDEMMIEGGTVTSESASITIEEFESLSLQNNPTIAELVATTQKAAGFRTQVGLRANPTVGYDATQLADQGTDQHTIFISQTIITADKLRLNRKVLDEALRSQLMQLEAQKYRVATDVRIKFYIALAAQRRLALIRDFQAVSDKGLEFAQLRKQAQEGSQLDVVQARVLKNEIDLRLQQAEVRFLAAWRELAAIAGVPNMAPVALAGELPKESPALEWEVVASSILASSPEYQAALARVGQARANLCRQQVQPTPNIDVEIASGYDNGTDNGMINLQIGAPLPLFNWNQGNINAARAEYARASREVERIEDSIRARLATVSGDLESSLAAVRKFSSDIVPNAREGLRLAELAYQAGETSYVQVLIAQRMFFDASLQFIEAQAELGQAQAKIDGYLLTGALDPVVDDSGDDGLRGLTLGQQ